MIRDTLAHIRKNFHIFVLASAILWDVMFAADFVYLWFYGITVTDDQIVPAALEFATGIIALSIVMYLFIYSINKHTT